MAAPTVTSRPYKQDLPPKGGYDPVPFKRVQARRIVNGPILFGGAILCFSVSYPFYKAATKRKLADEVEMKSATLALEPLLLAERDREFLKQLRLNREYEREVMKDVEGWEVGTWFGEPVYQKSKRFESPSFQEFTVFSRPGSARTEFNLKKWTHI